MNELTTISNERIDKLEVAMTHFKPLNCPVNHTFLPGMYIREIFMPKGTEDDINMITSLVHNTTHPFFVLKGKVAVFSDNEGEIIIEAPYKGITLPLTRRVLRIIEDTVWVTCHCTDVVPKNNSKDAINEAVKLVGEQILMKYENTLLGGHFVNNSFVPNQELITH